MRICADCGSALADNALFCPVCGAKAPEEAAPVVETAPVEEAAPAVEAAPAEEAIPAVETVPVEEPVWAEQGEPAAGGFCYACGAALEAGSLFCPVCGASTDPAAAVPVAAEPAAETEAAAGFGVAGLKKKMGSKHLGMLAVGAAAVVVLLLGVWLVSGLLGGPNTKFLSHHQKMISSLAEKEFGSLVENESRLATLSTDMTLTAHVNNSYPNAQLINRYLDDSAVVLKVDFNKTSAKVGGEVIVDGDTVVSGTVLYDKGTVGIQIPEVDETYYTADLARLVENLTGERIEGLNSLEFPQIPEKSLEKAVKTYLGVAAKAVTKKNTTAEKSTFRLDHLPGKRQEGTKYTFTPEAEDIEEMLNALADALEKDKDLHKLANDLVGDNAKLVNSALAELTEYDTLDEALDDGLSQLAKQISGRNARSAGKAVENTDFTWTLWVGKDNIYKGEISTDNDYSRLCYERTDNGFALWSEYGSYQEDILVIEYEKEGKLYHGTYTAGRASLEFEDVDTSKQSALGYYYGTYKVRDYYGDEVVTIEVEDGLSGGTDHVITMPGYHSYDGDDYYYYSYYERLINSAEIVLNTTDKKSTLSTPKGRKEDITDYDERDFERLFQELSDDLRELTWEISQRISSDSGYYYY